MSDPIREESFLRQTSQKMARDTFIEFGHEGMVILNNRYNAETSAELWRLLLSAAAYNTDNFNRLPEPHRSNFKSDIGKLWDTVAAISDSADELRNDLLAETAFVHLDAGQPLDDIARSRLIALAKRLLSIVRRRIEAVDDEKFRTQFSPTAAEIVLMDEMGKPSILSAPAGEVGAEEEKPKPGATDPFAGLREFARDTLKGQERAVIEALCDAGGELAIADLAVKDGVVWDEPFQGFKNVQKRLNPKVKRIGWTLARQNNAAILNRIMG